MSTQSSSAAQMNKLGAAVTPPLAHAQRTTQAWAETIDSPAGGSAANATADPEAEVMTSEFVEIDTILQE